MKQKKILLSIITIMIVIISFLEIFTKEVQAATASPSRYFGINEIRKNDTPNFGYAIGDPNTNGTTGRAAKIWNILEYTGTGSGAQEKAGGSKNIYCVKAGVGFSDTHKSAEYNVFYNMKTEKDQIKAQNDVLKSIVEGNVTKGTTTVSKYDALLALSDMLYLIDDSSSDTTKTEYLKNAGIESAYYDYLLTRDDIMAVQQAAIWYFTNNGEESNKYDKTVNSGWLNYTTDGVTYKSLGDYNLSTYEGRQRQEEAEILYNYLIDSAIANAGKYSTTTGTTGGQPAKVTTTALNYEISGSNYIIGPIHIDNVDSTKVYTIEMAVKSGDKNISYTLLDSSKTAVSSETTVKDLVGKDFYISVSQKDVSEISVSIKIKYTDKTLTLWASSKNNQEQPLMIVEEKEQEKETILKVLPETPFDLALRKYITKVNGVELTGANSRVPNIDESTLTSGTTATYKHRKDPVEVKTGDTVTYKITIYNEGQAEGRATKVVDQLPTGLTFSKVVSGNFEQESYDATTNILNLKRKEGNTTNLVGYTAGNLQSETIEIECKVEATSDTTSSKTLTNVAWISEEVNGITGETITNQTGKDRDSEPSTKPDVNKDNMENYTGNGNKTDLSDNTYYYKGQQDDDDFEKVIVNKQNPGKYNLVLVKEDANGEQLDSKATFEVNGESKEVTGKLTIAENVEINSSNVGTNDVYTIRETKAPDKYCEFNGTIQVTIIKEQEGETYKVKEVTYKVLDEGGNDITAQTGEEANVQLSSDGNIYVNVKDYQFDLALRKYITKINGTEVANSRVPVIDESTLTSGTTATYKHRKDPVQVELGDTVTYNLTIYNEGQIEGRATKVVDQLPTGLTFSKVVSGNYEQESYDTTTNTLTLTRKSGDTTNLGAYTAGNMQSETIEIECIVDNTVTSTTSKTLTNVAWISEEVNGKTNETITNQTGKDRDSEPSTKPDVNKDNMENYKGDSSNKDELTDSNYYYKGEQDDDDFEKVVINPGAFDLKLIKRITAVNNQNVPERIESVDVSKLNTTDESGKVITTGEYKLNKEPVNVKKGDIVTYTFRIYNEGTIDGYAAEITEDIPEGLEFITSEKTEEELQADTTLSDEEKEAIEFNKQYMWTAGTEKTIKTSYLSKENEKTEGENLIQAFGKNDGSKTEKDIHYKEVSVKLKVIVENSDKTIRNEACISKDSDKDGKETKDRDSDPKDWKKYEDDEDCDNVKLPAFDLALRKFIIAVGKDENLQDSDYLKNGETYTRAPIVDTTKLNTKDESGNLITTAIYNHTKEPVLVTQNSVVVYMLRAYNEGDLDGYAAEIKDHLPSYLEFIDNDYNKQYGWEVSEDGRVVTTKYLENTIIKKAEKNAAGSYDLSYAEVPIMCKVSGEAKSNENITNIADIAKYEDENKKEITDRDSGEDNLDVPSDDNLPGYKDGETGEYIPGQEDDDDFEKVVVKTFDLALRKWVTQAITIDKSGTNITQTGHQPYDDPEQIVKVDLHRKHINDVTVKFRYSVRVINEGDVAGYAKEVKDYIPEGLKFVAEDNPQWTQVSDNIITTEALANTLLQPGEYADVEVVLTWINNENNMGLKVNTAEISKDYNDYNLPDKDSTPDNQKPGEDDIDDAPVMLSVSTGAVRTYFMLTGVVLITLAGGIVLIKKYII